MKNLLIIGHTFPEPTTTAAGTRIMQLIGLFEEEGYKITFASTAIASEKSFDLNSRGIHVESIALNDIGFDEFVKRLNPNVVIFDRYITEEQFGWRVAEQCPGALRILDTEDLHFLRKAREQALKDGRAVADADLFTEIAKRELASILRSDLSLIISEAEIKLLIETFSISATLLHYLPFLLAHLSEETINALPNFQERNHFITIGNFQHAPNVDSVLWLRDIIWPKIRKELPQAELHIYGAYAPKSISDLHNTNDGFFIKGWIDDVKEVVQEAKVCLAPLRFGAGLKGKFIDAMTSGTPSVTTSIGAEGIAGSLPFAGRVSDVIDDIVKHSVELFTDEDKWREAQQNGFDIIKQRFQKDLFSEAFKTKITVLTDDLIQHRKKHFIGQILQQNSLQATKYMSKWIEAKNSLKN